MIGVLNFKLDVILFILLLGFLNISWWLSQEDNDDELDDDLLEKDDSFSDEDTFSDSELELSNDMNDLDPSKSEDLDGLFSLISFNLLF